MQLFIAVYIFLITCTHFQYPSDAAVSMRQQPNRTEFLSELLGLAESIVHKVARSFAFGKVSAENITIIQYTENGNQSINLLHNESLKIDFHKKIVIIVHGFQSSGGVDWVKNMAKAYHDVGICNTLAVDWRKIAAQNYLSAAHDTKGVGWLVGDWLYKNVLLNNSAIVKNLHLVGHSLGAHISGFIAKRILELTGNIKVGRISALDAAGPLFEYPIQLPPSHRLNKNDSYHVEAYHTNGGFFGFFDPIAKQDFFINGGIVQPGCIKGINAIEIYMCSHGFSHEFFTKTITSAKYVATQCKTKHLSGSLTCDPNLKVIMGEHNNGTSLYGNFYAEVDEKVNPI